MRWRDWLGVGERRWRKAPDEEVQPAKTLWDWLQLLIVPAILIAVTFAWSYSQTRADNEREDRRIEADRAAAKEARRDATLQAYLDQMSGLMLHESLLSSHRGAPVRSVARTITFTTLRRVDGKRKGEVVLFLQRAGLIRNGGPREDAPVVDLDGADLTGADLSFAWVTDARLYGADLRGADLTGAVLHFTDLSYARLARAYLSRADLTSVVLASADFTSANLTGAYLADTDVSGALNLDLGLFITGLSPDRQREFLDSQKAFLDSLSPKELATFNLSPEKLAKIRREASGG